MNFLLAGGMDVSFILDALNDKQREAVAAPLQNSLVLAGAGSGKTRVLVHRIAWLMHAYELSPYSLMAVTFTNKAAREMQGRIEQLVGVPPQGMWVGTFHGLAHRLLRAHWRDAGLKENFQIMDSDDQLRLIKRIMRDMSIDETRWPPKQVAWFINAQKDEGLRSNHIQDEGDLYIRTHLSIYRAYEEACDRGGMVDFAELLLRMHETLLAQPALLNHYRERFKVILVDEFQDTSPIQLEIFWKLSQFAKFSIWVGDPKQSIYGFRGADPELMQAIIKQTGGVKPEDIQEFSWRSRQDLVHAVNAIFVKAFPNLPVEQIALKPAPPKVKSKEPFEQDNALIHWHYQKDTPGKQMPGKPWMENCLADFI